MMTEWKENTQVGFTATLVFIVLLLICIFLIPNLYHFFQRMKDRNTVRPFGDNK